MFTIRFEFTARITDITYLFSHGSAGSLWFADFVVEDTALVNTVRRAGAPLRVYTSDGARTFVEGRDFDPIAPATNFTGFSKGFRNTANVTLPATRGSSTLQPGNRVLIDYYAVDLVFGGDTYACMMHHDMFAYMQKSMEVTLAQYSKYRGMFIHYDEIRLMHGCELCSGPFDTAGELLAWHARNATATIRQSNGGFTGEVGTWDDMFNPFHNAGDDYFLINGTLKGSWNGLDKDVLIWNWGAGAGNDATGRQGLEFFAKRQHKQIFAGYYDSHDGAGTAKKEMAIAKGVPGIEGFMYTTWRNDYTQLCAYAETLRNVSTAEADRRQEEDFRHRTIKTPAQDATPDARSLPRRVPHKADELVGHFSSTATSDHGGGGITFHAPHKMSTNAENCASAGGATVLAFHCLSLLSLPFQAFDFCIN